MTIYARECGATAMSIEPDSEDASRAITPEEARTEFLEHMCAMVRYWYLEERSPTALGKLSGLMHSFLVSLDGCAAGLPAFCMAPCPHPEDKQFHIDEGSNYYADHDDEGTIGGGLHEEMYTVMRRVWPDFDLQEAKDLGKHIRETTSPPALKLDDSPCNYCGSLSCDHDDQKRKQ